MGARGPKPVHLGSLQMWEFEWFKALHLLREGIQLPEPPRPPLRPGDEARIDARIRNLEKMPLEKIVDEDPPPADYNPEKPGDRAPLYVWRPWAERMRYEEIQRFRKMKPREMQAKAERREIWKALWSARRRSAVEQACDRWEKLSDVEGSGFEVFAVHVRAHAQQFLAITGNPRFPRSAAADDSRLNYIARGMAGVMVGVSPMTGIERLRNIQHKPGGPFWNRRARRCACWRCVYQHWYDSEAAFREGETI